MRFTLTTLFNLALLSSAFAQTAENPQCPNDLTTTRPAKDCSNLCPSFTYNITTGDTITVIQDRFHVPICEIGAENNITNIDYIEANTLLTIPAQECGADKECPYCDYPAQGFHIIESGDTYYLIAEYLKSLGLNTTYPELEALNPDKPAEFLVPGEGIELNVCAKKFSLSAK